MPTYRTSGVELAVAAAAVARLTRLVTDDTLTAGFRAGLIRRFGPDSWPASLVGCPWCVSVWAGLAAAAAAHRYGHCPAARVLAGGLAASWVTGVAATWLDRED